MSENGPYERKILDATRESKVWHSKERLAVAGKYRVAHLQNSVTCPTIWEKPWLVCLLIAAVGIACYANTLHVPFQMDEWPLIADNPLVKDLGFYGDPFSAAEFPEYGLFLRRYVPFFTFAINYGIHGTRVEGYHVVNIGVHVINGLLVFALCRLLLITPYWKETFTRTGINLFAAVTSLLFVCHPVQTEAVTYVQQRFASLAALFYLGAMCAYIVFRCAANNDGSSRFKMFAWYSASIACALCAMASKQNAATLPVMLAMVEWLFFDEKVWRRILYLAPFFCVVGLIPLTMALSGFPPLQILLGAVQDVEPHVRESVFDMDYVRPSISRWSYFVTQIRVISTYIRLVIVPFGQNFDYDYPLYTSIWVWPIMWSAGMQLLLVLVAGMLVSRSRRKPHAMRLVAFGIGWFFLALIVESSVMPIPMLIAEYRLYLPIVGALVGIVATGWMMLSHFPGESARKVIAAALSSVIIVALGITTVQRNTVWANEISLWEDVARKSPNKGRVHNNLGSAYYEARRLREAVQEYLKVLKLDPQHVEATYNLGEIAFSEGREEQARKYYERYFELRQETGGRIPHVRLRQADTRAHGKLGVLYLKSGRPADAVEHLRQARESSLGEGVLSPGNLGEISYNLGVAYQALGQRGKAAQEYRYAVEVNPRLADAYMNLGIVFFQDGRMDEAVKQFKEALAVQPHSDAVYYNLGEAYAQKGDLGQAASYFRMFVERDPNNVGGYEELAATLERLGRLEEAKVYRDRLKKSDTSRDPRE